MKRGFRATRLGKKQLHLCTKCGRKFTNKWPKMRFKRGHVMYAVKLYKEGMSAAKVKSKMEGKGVTVSRWTIIKWHRKFG